MVQKGIHFGHLFGAKMVKNGSPNRSGFKRAAWHGKRAWLGPAPFERSEIHWGFIVFFEWSPFSRGGAPGSEKVTKMVAKGPPKWTVLGSGRAAGRGAFFGHHFGALFVPKGCPRGSFLGTFWGAFSVRFPVRFFGGCSAPEGATTVKKLVGIRAQERVGRGINSSPWIAVLAIPDSSGVCLCGCLVLRRGI